MYHSGKQTTVGKYTSAANADYFWRICGISKWAPPPRVISDGQCPSLACPFLFTLLYRWHGSGQLLLLLLWRRRSIRDNKLHSIILFLLHTLILFHPRMCTIRRNTRYRFSRSRPRRFSLSLIFFRHTLSIYKWTSNAKQWNRSKTELQRRHGRDGGKT